MYNTVLLRLNARGVYSIFRFLGGRIFEEAFNRGGVYKFWGFSSHIKFKKPTTKVYNISSSLSSFSLSKVKRGSSFDNVLIQKLKRKVKTCLTNKQNVSNKLWEGVYSRRAFNRGGVCFLNFEKRGGV